MVATATRGDLSFECMEEGCTFYADGERAQARCREHARISGHPLHNIVGTACFFFPEVA